MTLKVIPKATAVWGLHYCENCGKTWHEPSEMKTNGSYGQVNIPIEQESTQTHRVMLSYLICIECADKLGLEQSTTPI